MARRLKSLAQFYTASNRGGYSDQFSASRVRRLAVAGSAIVECRVVDIFRGSRYGR
jgi:hypothetical protein